MTSANRFNIVTVATTVASTSMISMLARPIWTTFNTKTRRYARSCKSTNARFKSRSRRGRSKRRGPRSPNLQATYITWCPPRPFQECTILHSLTWSLRHSTSRWNSTLSLHSRLTISGSHPIRRRLSFSGLYRWSSKKRWNSRKYSIKKLSRSDHDLLSPLLS